MSRIALLVAAGMTALAGARANDIAILSYLHSTWDLLTRSHQDLAAAAADPKSHPDSSGQWRVYLPADEDRQRLNEQLRRQRKPSDFTQIALHPLPDGQLKLNEHGLLYLPKPY